KVTAIVAAASKLASVFFIRVSFGTHLAHVSPRVFLLDWLIGNFLERVLVCVLFIVLTLLFRGFLLVAFLPELATTLSVPHLGVGGHRQYRYYRSNHEGSHFGAPRCTHFVQTWLSRPQGFTVTR